MRYESIDKISFTDKNGRTAEIKDIREYPSYNLLIAIKLKDEDEVDEIASRPEIYGDDAEGESFKIVDNNIVKLFENDFDLSGLEKLNIPL